MNRKKKINYLVLNFLNKNATWKSILLLFGLIIVFNFFIFPLFYPTNLNTTILDTQFSYSPEKAYKILADYNKEELKEYCIGELSVDIIYPIVYTLFLCFFSFKLSKKAILSLFPLLILFSDYIENFGIVTIINYYPQKLPDIVRITSLFSSLKWTLLAFTIFIFFALLIIKISAKKCKDN